MIHVYKNNFNGLDDFKKFVILRFGRIYPLHLFILLIWVPYVLPKLAVYLYFGLGNDPTTTYSIKSFISNLFLVHSLNIHDSLTWNGPSWSISTEFYTYLVFAIFLFVIPKRIRTLSALVISALVLYTFLSSGTQSFDRTYDLGFLRCVSEFFMGVVLYGLFLLRTYNPSKLVASCVEILAMAGIFYSVSRADVSIYYSCIAITSFLVVVYVFSVQNNGIISEILNSKPMQLLGNYSYSIYMLHALIVTIFANIFTYVLKVEKIKMGSMDYIYIGSLGGLVINFVIVLLVIFLSRLTFNYIEKPYRNKFRHISERVSKGKTNKVLSSNVIN